jgi:hypothetical protein
MEDYFKNSRPRKTKKVKKVKKGFRSTVLEDEFKEVDP